MPRHLIAEFVAARIDAAAHSGHEVFQLPILNEIKIRPYGRQLTHDAPGQVAAMAFAAVQVRYDVFAILGGVVFWRRVDCAGKHGLSSGKQTCTQHRESQRVQDGPRSHAREVKRVASREICKRGDLDRFVQMSKDIVSESREQVLAQHARDSHAVQHQSLPMGDEDKTHARIPAFVLSVYGNSLPRERCWVKDGVSICTCASVRDFLEADGESDHNTRRRYRR
jgi:hypothetical protein